MLLASTDYFCCDSITWSSAYAAKPWNLVNLALALTLPLSNTSESNVVSSYLVLECRYVLLHHTCHYLLYMPWLLLWYHLFHRSFIGGCNFLQLCLLHRMIILSIKDYAKYKIYIEIHTASHCILSPSMVRSSVTLVSNYPVNQIHLGRMIWTRNIPKLISLVRVLSQTCCAC